MKNLSGSSEGDGLGQGRTGSGKRMRKDAERPRKMAKFGSKAVVGSGEERLELRIRSSMKGRFLGAEGSWEA